MRMDLSRRMLESFRSRWIIPRVCSSVLTVNVGVTLETFDYIYHDSTDLVFWETFWVIGYVAM
jgi:hypothetical protein